ncbi:MAG: hypothetical protein Q8N57_02680 [bacterium]|nr:hypothetical protein [bacterium]
MKISKTFKKEVAAAAKKLETSNQVFLNQPFQDSYVTIEKPEQADNITEMKFRDAGIDRDGTFFLIMKIM